mmetsp:Transcript_22623/g.49204  ORF Transcript_22623/g.49204 Transcript_22623/m.49204 type:complete len:216 (-) Transcript_22623:452-1099(-)
MSLVLLLLLLLVPLPPLAFVFAFAFVFVLAFVSRLKTDAACKNSPNSKRDLAYQSSAVMDWSSLTMDKLGLFCSCSCSYNNSSSSLSSRLQSLVLNDKSTSRALWLLVAFPEFPFELPYEYRKLFGITELAIPTGIPVTCSAAHFPASLRHRWDKMAEAFTSSVLTRVGSQFSSNSCCCCCCCCMVLMLILLMLVVVAVLLLVVLLLLLMMLLGV